MKIFICSDLHINESKRFEDTQVILSVIVEQVKKLKPEHVFVLGDIFDKRRPTPIEMRCLNHWLLDIRNQVKEVILLEGNHDQDRGISSLSYLSDLRIRGVRVVNPPYKAYGFYLGHEQINGAVSDTGLELSGGKSMTDLIKENPDVTVFAFGHFHKPQILKKNPLVFYAGSIVNKTFGERNHTKVTWLFDQTDFTATEHELPNRKMYQFVVDLAGDKAVSVPWLAKDLAGSLVKIVFSGTASDLKRVDKEKIMKLKEQKEIYDLLVEYNVIDKTKARNDKINEEVTEETALREYFNAKDLDDSTKEDIVTKGLELISKTKEGLA